MTRCVSGGWSPRTGAARDTANRAPEGCKEEEAPTGRTRPKGPSLGRWG